MTEKQMQIFEQNCFRTAATLCPAGSSTPNFPTSTTCSFYIGRDPLTATGAKTQSEQWLTTVGEAGAQSSRVETLCEGMWHQSMGILFNFPGRFP